MFRFVTSARSVHVQTIQIKLCFHASFRPVEPTKRLLFNGYPQIDPPDVFPDFTIAMHNAILISRLYNAYNYLPARSIFTSRRLPTLNRVWSHISCLTTLSRRHHWLLFLVSSPSSMQHLGHFVILLPLCQNEKPYTHGSRLHILTPTFLGYLIAINFNTPT